ncbi:hypothetical protein AAZV13_08G002200 [Glycine max]
MVEAEQQQSLQLSAFQITMLHIALAAPAERSNGARYFRVFGGAGEPVPPCSQALSGNDCNCGFSLREKMAALEVLWRRYPKPKRSLRISRGLITRTQGVHIRWWIWWLIYCFKVGIIGVA